MPISDTETWRYVFKHNSGPLAWLIMSSQLKRSAQVLWKQFDYSYSLGGEAFAESDDQGIDIVAFYLDAIALETIVKTCRLIEGLTTPDADGAIEWHLGDGHDLVNLSAGLRCLPRTQCDSKFLHRMSEIIRWGGKYPNPKKFDRLLVEYPNGAKLPPRPHDDDRERCCQVYDTLHEFAHQELVGNYIKRKTEREKET
jgi:hypothetical protein